MLQYNIYDYEMTDQLKQHYENTLEQLTERWKMAKKASDDARALQLVIEEAVLALPEVRASLKDIGTNNFGPLRITTKVTQKWDQEALSSILESIDALPLNVFEVEYKPVGAKMKILKEEFPEIYQQLAQALTITPAKAAFTIAGKEVH